MSSPTPEKFTLEQESYARQHDIRGLVCLAAAGTLISKLGWAELNWPGIGFFILLVIYSISSYWFIKHRAIQQHLSFERFMTIDAILIGGVIGFEKIDLLPTILFVMLVQFNSLINGGIRKWTIDNTALVIGILLTSYPTIAFKTEDIFNNQLEISSASMIGVLVYFCAYALYAHNRTRLLEGKLKTLFNEQRAHKMRIYKMARYLPPTIERIINEDRDKSLVMARKEVTVFFSDIQGFGALSEEIGDELLMDMLTKYMHEMARIAQLHRGTIDKFMGDAIMVSFGDMDSEGVKSDCIRAVSMAIDMRRKLKQLESIWISQGFTHTLNIRMGINTGRCIVGHFGSNLFMNYTLLGQNVNIASRLESAAATGEILISHKTFKLVEDVFICQDKGEIRVKATEMPIRVYAVIDYRKELGKAQSWFSEKAEGFSMHLDLDKVTNYEKERVIEALQKAADRLKEKNIK